MHIEKLRMQNFRGFKDVTIDFPSNLAVFIGVNGSGKSSIIDCLDNLLFELISRLLRVTRNAKNFSTRGMNGFGENDISNGSQETINELTISYSEFSEAFSRDIQLLYCFGYPSSSEEPQKDFQRSIFEDVGNFKIFINTQINNNPNKSIPIIVCYSTKRSVTNYRLSGSDPLSPNVAKLSQVNCYTDATNQYNIDFETFFVWFKNNEDLEQEIRLDGNLDYQDYQLNLVRKAITSILPDYSDLKVKRSRMQIVLKKQDHELVLNQLSDGEKNLLVMVADIARRLAIANPDPTKNALEGEGIILIDEIELHLHPQWQRDIIPRLTSTFPNCQFIVTTHSPQVLSNVKKENVFIVEDFQVYPADAYTFGRDSNSILSELMGVTERPIEIQNKLTECLYKIDDGQIEEAKVLLRELSDLLGHNDSEIVKANTLISFLSKVK
ncbi:AAA family ATPase [Pseudanabaena sp. FACHB-1277]|uniref:AAA family ATPase n=1 Tax=Pseudanabaena cinerea FACHB-1277 TaxID=2949581 RepID=A0A926UUK6_9CYAN|nr:AAA family ATPase [Pseudanabaena cinerea]MBD2151148.1 AAA family ATPase [Pseudanabaena cinerea FACHB-1277]